MLQNVYVAFHPAGNVPIGWWLFVWASIQLVLSQLPTMRHLRHLTFAAALALVFWTVLVVVECFQIGVVPSSEAPSSDCVPQTIRTCTNGSSCLQQRCR